jgi:hypothetical protein
MHTSRIIALAIASGLLVTTAGCKDKEHAEKIAKLEAALAAATTANQELDAQVKGVATAQAAVEKRLHEVEVRTPGIGYFTPGWSYRGIHGANSLKVRATPIKGKPEACHISGNFEFSGAITSPLLMTVYKDGGESAFETSVTLSEGGFEVKQAPIACPLVSKVSFAPK